jgi:hypothetical protein
MIIITMTTIMSVARTVTTIITIMTTPRRSMM